MSGLSQLIYLFLLLLLAGACRVQPELQVSTAVPAVADDSASMLLAQRLDDFVQSLVPQSFNGALLIEKDGKLLLARGYGRIQPQENLPFNMQSIGNTASFAQQLTAVALLSLQEQGSLHLNDTLSRFFTGLPPDKQGISLQHLLSHRAGFSDDLLPDPLLKQDFLVNAWQQPLQFLPGSDYQYSRTGYAILTAVIEEVSGQSYEAYVRQHLLEPAGMKNTGYVLTELQDPELARSRNSGVEIEPLQDYQALSPALWPQLGSGGMLSNAHDLYRWQHMLFEAKLLNAATLKILWGNRGGVPEGESAYGWRLEESPAGSPVLIHNSHADGFACQLLYDQQERISIVLLANQYNRQVEELGYQLARMLYHPFYMPALLPYSEQNFVRLPQGPGAEHLRGLMEVLTREKVKISAAFVEAHYSAAFRKNASERMHLNALQQLQQRLAGAQLIQAEREWPYFHLTYSVPDKKLAYLLRVELEPEAPYQLSSIELEISDSLP